MGEERDGEWGGSTSSSWAIARRCCFAIAVSFCWTIRSREMDSLSCTLSLFWGLSVGGTAGIGVYGEAYYYC